MNLPMKSHCHWPFFAQTLCGSMTDRERMGLPDHYLEGRLDKAIAAAYNPCLSMSILDLLAKIHSSHSSLAERIACGNVLALQGDPRLNVFDPTMLVISGGDVSIGLPDDLVDDVLARFAGLGLNRMWIEKECPQHTVQLQAFKLAKYPVTNAEFQVFLIDTQYAEIPNSWTFRRYPIERSNHPVYTVTAQAADAYVSWLSQRTGRAFRLPTEAEWEWAAAGPQGLEFPWGNTFDPAHTNTAETGLFQSTSVGIFNTGYSPFGIADMAGNVEEYVSNSYRAYPNGHAVIDHLVDIHGQYRVARGGSFARFRDLARTKRRHGHNPKSPTYAMGFRLAESVA